MQDEDDAEPEGWQTNANECRDAGDVVKDATALERGQHAHRHRDNRPDEEGQNSDAESLGQRVLDLRGDRLTGVDGFAEVTAHDVAHPGGVLDVERFIESEVLANLGCRLGSVFAAQHGRDRIAGHEPQEEEDDRRAAPDDEDCVDQPADYVRRHQAPPWTEPRDWGRARAV